MKLNFKDKKILIPSIILGILILIFILIELIVPLLIKGTIQTVGPAVTGVPITVSSITLNPFTGRFKVSDFRIGNPKGYESPYTFKLTKFYVDVDMLTLFSSKLVIESIQIHGVELNYETNLIKSNIGEIQETANRNLGIQPDTDKGAKETKEAEPVKNSVTKPVQINHLELDDITAWVIIKGTKAQAPLMLMPVVMNDLGTGPEGITSAAVINDVVTSMLTGITNSMGLDAAAKDLEKNTKSTIKSLKQSTKDAVKSVNSALKSIGNIFKK